MVDVYGKGNVGVIHFDAHYLSPLTVDDDRE